MTEASAPAIDPALEAGLELRRAGDLAGADAAFRRAAEVGDATALYLVGLARFEAGDPHEAERLVARAASLTPDDAQLQLTLANLRQHLHDARGAAAAFGRARELAPHNVAALTGHAQALLACGDPLTSLRAAEGAVAAASHDAEARLALASALAALKRPVEAADAYRAATHLAPSLAPAHLGLAVTLLQAGDPAAALPAAERSIALDETAALGWLTLGTAQRRLGRLGPAAAALERALALSPGTRGALLGLGLIYAELERPALAEQRLSQALAVDPDDKEAHAVLSTVLCNAGRFAPARAHAERALARDPTLITARQNLARALAAEGRREEAKVQRDLAYGARSFFASEGPAEAPRVLVLAHADIGNTPDRHLLPASRFTRLFWFIEYAPADQMRALPPYDVVFNGIGDADEAGPTAANVTRFLAGCAAPVLNLPATVARTRRSLASTLFADIDDLVVPRCVHLTAEALAQHGLIAAAGRAGIAPPFIVRPLGSHGGQGARLVATAGEPPPLDGRDRYVTAFHDARSPDGLYRKYRVIFVAGEPYPYHLAIGSTWLAHYNTSGTAAHAQRLAEERRFLDQPEAALGARAMAAVRAIGARLDLDFAGLDFALSGDGRVLFFEANATMLVHPEDPAGPLAHKNPHVSRILTAFGDLVARQAATGANRASVASSERSGSWRAAESVSACGQDPPSVSNAVRSAGLRKPPALSDRTAGRRSDAP